MQQIVKRLTPIYGLGEARALARLLLEEAFGFTYTDIVCGKVSELSAEDLERLETYVCRLERHEPIQYVLGYADFCDHRFHVSPGVLIPRPETELLVEAIQHVPGVTSILDIGTGSGCIAISLALALPEAHVEAWDISHAALRIAQDNAQRLSAANVTFREVDVLSQPPTDGRFSLIVSNPPYICRRESQDMAPNVLDHEPHEALFVPDDDPLLFYRAIATLGTQLLTSGGQLWFEINRAYGADVCLLMQSLGYIGVHLQNDQFDNPRIVSGTLQLFT